MPTGTITKRSVDALKTDPSNCSAPSEKYPEGRIKDVYLWDDKLPGFGVKATGPTTKTYLFQYRDKTKRTRRVTIGKHGKNPWTPEKAREEAGDIAARIRLGENPAQDKTAGRAAESVTEASKAFLDDHMATKRKARTVEEYKRLFDNNILPRLGRLALADVTRAEVAHLHHTMKKTPYHANRALAVLSSMFTWAIRHGLYSGNNPCLLIERYKEKKKERFLSPVELARMGETLAKYEKAAPVGVAAIRMLIFTGMRKNEVLTLRWNEIDLETGTIQLSDSKTGAKPIPLSAPTLEILESMNDVRQEENPFVFPGNKEGKHLVGLQKIWGRIRSEATLNIWEEDSRAAKLIEKLQSEDEKNKSPTVEEIREAAKSEGIELPRGLDDVRIHDFRHSFASVGASGGDSLVILGSILGHADGVTTARYARLYDDPRKAAAERIAGEIAANLNGSEGDVVKFERPSKNTP